VQSCDFFLLCRVGKASMLDTTGGGQKGACTCREAVPRGCFARGSSLELEPFAVSVACRASRHDGWCSFHVACVCMCTKLFFSTRARGCSLVSVLRWCGSC
jgi:hypothetical protein